jgi:hypothetical protein
MKSLRQAAAVSSAPAACSVSISLTEQAGISYTAPNLYGVHRALHTGTSEIDGCPGLLLWCIL